MDKHLMKKRINEVIKTDATVVELQDFMATHMPFKKLKYYKSGIEAIKGKELNEEDFFYEFIDNAKDKHNFIVVQGDNGSGKSHFIRWIKNKITSEESFPDDVVILLERSQNTLQATIKQLVNNEIIQSFLSEEEKAKLKNTGIELTEDKFIAMINYNFIIEAENEDEDEDCVLKLNQRKGLIELLKEEVIQKQVLFVENGPIKRIANKLISSDESLINEGDIRFTENDFEISSNILKELKESESNRKALRFAENLKDDRRGIRGLVAEYLNSKIDTVIQRTIKLNSADLNLILEKIRFKLKEIGKNLILFIEDITAFTGVDKGVIENLIVEHREDNGLCRLFSVIGVTTGYYQSHFPDNLKDRVTGRVFIDSESLFEEKNDIIELAARYINAINIPKDELKRWISLGASDMNLPIKSSEREWDIYKDRNNREFALFPLTENAIINLYNEIKDKKTPRRFIKNILLPTLMHYVTDRNFPEGISELESEITIPKFKNEFINKRIDSEINDEYENSRTKCLLRIWGNGTIDYLEQNNRKYIGNIDERIFDEFRIKKIVGNKVSSNNKIKSNKASSEMHNRPLEKVNTVSEENKKTEIAKERVISKQERDLEALNLELKRWYEKEENLKVHPKIRENICRFIKEIINWDIEEVSWEMVDSAISLNNLKIEGQQVGEEKVSNIIWIERTEDNYYFLLSLMRYVTLGEKTWNYENAQDDIVIVIKWIEANKNKIINYVVNGNDKDYDMYKYAMEAEIYRVVLNKKIMVKNKEINIKDMSLDQLYKSIIDKLVIEDEKKLEPILGQFSIAYIDKKCDIINNHNFIIEYYNCPLGAGKGKFLDAYEILKVLNELRKDKFNINNFNDIEFTNVKKLWKNPYDLLQKNYKAKLELAVSKKLNEIKLKGKEYIGNFEDVGIINELFETLENNNIMFDNKIKFDFDNIFEDTVKYNKYKRNREKIESCNNLDLLDKIYLLKSYVPREIRKYNEVLEEVESLMRIQNEKYRNKYIGNGTSEEEVNDIVNKCISKIEIIEKDLQEVKENLEC